MHPNLKAMRAAHEVTLQYKSRLATMPAEERIEERLAQSLDFIRLMRQTPPGATELRRRGKLFGDCKRLEGEPSGQFCARLRHWLDRDLPSTKFSRRASGR
jgi:hypothetical protein